MSALRRLLLRLYRVFRREAAEQDLARELGSHLTLLEDEFRRRGMPPADAARAARVAIGGVEQVKEMQRDARSFLWLEDMRRDIGYGLRTLARAPGFALAAAMTLALGIGAVTVIYSVLRNVVLEPFPYARSDRLVNVVLRDESGRGVRGPYFPAPEFLDYQEQATVFEDVVGSSQDAMLWASDAGAERLVVVWMTPNGFNFLGVAPMLGRVFGNADVAPGAAPVAVMNHRVWVTLFGADPGIIGRTLMLDGKAWTVIGVMPPRFEWNIADLWLPAALNRSDDPRTPRGFRAFQAHLHPGVTPKQAEAQLVVVAARRAAAYPTEYPAHSHLEVIKVVDWVVREFRGELYTLFGAVTLLLLIACCNVANMLLARATTRGREIAIRLAIGASRSRIVRQLLVESALLATGGLIAGCALAYAGIRALARFMPRQGVPWETQIRVDVPVLVFGIVAAGVATVAFGLFPAVQSVRDDVSAGIGPGGRSTAARRQKRLRGSLVVAQVALSIVLLLGAGLLMRTFVKLLGVDLGFETKNLLIAPVGLPPRLMASADAQRVFYRGALDRLSTTAGVRSAAIANGDPLGGPTSRLEIPGLAVPPEALSVVVFCSDRLFETVGVPLVRGRHLSAIDVEQSHRVTVINETMAKKYFANDDPLGRTIRLPRLATLPIPVVDPTFTIVGIVRDVANQGPRNPPAPAAYIPFGFRGPAGFTFLLRTSTEPQRLVAAIREQIQAIDRQVALLQPITEEEVLQRVFYARPRFSLLLLGIFASVGTLLVAFGIYGVLAYIVSQQTREIAIRMALGGERADVMKMVVRVGLRLVAIGLVIGLGASLLTNRLLVTQLWNTSPQDPATVAAGVAVILAIGLLACWIPARRAVKVEPATALRHE